MSHPPQKIHSTATAELREIKQEPVMACLPCIERMSQAKQVWNLVTMLEAHVRSSFSSEPLSSSAMNLTMRALFRPWRRLCHMRWNRQGSRE